MDRLIYKVEETLPFHVRKQAGLGADAGLPVAVRRQPTARSVEIVGGTPAPLRLGKGLRYADEPTHPTEGKHVKTHRDLTDPYIAKSVRCRTLVLMRHGDILSSILH
jgi:hypothetical protein